MNRWFTGVGAALGLAALVMITPATAAEAAPAGGDGTASVQAYSDCPVGWFCAWENADGQGRMARFQIGSDDLRDFNLNDQISSVWNRTGVGWCTWLNINRDGGPWPVGNWRGNTSQYHRNDNISSLHTGAC